MKNKNYFLNSLPCIILIIIISFYTINNYLWLKTSSPVAFETDEAFHLSNMAGDYFSVNSVKGLLYSVKDANRSPLYHLTAVSANRLLGKSLFSTRMANIFWFTIALISIYKLGEYLFGREAGLLSALILSLYPAVYGYSRIFREEFGLMAVIPFTILFLLKSGGFQNRRYSLLFGIFFGIGVMVKYPFIIFIIGPAVYFLIKSITSNKEKKNKIWNFILSSIMIILVAYHRYWDLARIRSILLVPFAERGYQWYQFLSWRVFTLGIVNYQITLPFFLLFLFGLYFFIKRVRREVKITVLLWIFIPLAFFALIPHRKLTRQIIPYLPAIALISGFGITSIKKKLFRGSIVFLIIFIGLIQYYDFSFGIGAGLDKLKISILGKDIPYFYNSYHDINSTCSRPFRDSSYRGVLNYINRNSDSDRRALVLMPPSGYLDVERWRTFFWFQDSSLFKTVALKGDHNFIPALTEAIKDADFIFLSEQDINMRFPRYLDHQVEQVRHFFSTHFSEEDIEELEYFMQNDYPRCKEQFLRQTHSFKLAKSFYNAEKETVCLLQRNTLSPAARDGDSPGSP